VAHLLFVEAKFYTHISELLALGAIGAAQKSGATFERLAVPGALEIPGAIAQAAQARKYDGYVALGCVIRGETSHYDTVCNASARGIMDLTVRERLATAMASSPWRTRRRHWRAQIAHKWIKVAVPCWRRWRWSQHARAFPPESVQSSKIMQFSY
jgi:6,7-dimethyl-8-ribityllumazine synthase